MATESLSGGTSTLADLVARTLRRLRDEPWVEVCGANQSGTTVTLEANVDKRWKVGDILDGPTGNAKQIREITGNATVRVLDGYRDTATTALSSGDKVRKSPAYLYRQVEDAIKNAANDLWPRVPEIKSEQIVVTSPVPMFYDLPTDAEEVIEAYQLVDANSSTQRKRELPWHKGTWIDSDAGATSLKQLRVNGVATSASVSDLYITYTARPTVTTLTANQQELVIWSAIAALTGERLATITDPEKRTALTQTQRHAEQEYRDMLGLESERLRAMLPQHSRMTYIGVPHLYEGNTARNVGPIGAG